MKNKKLTKNQRYILNLKIRNLIFDTSDNIYKEKQIIPWSSTKVGPTYAVTTGAVGYNLDVLCKRITDCLGEE
jgi:hypothetical protein